MPSLRALACGDWPAWTGFRPATPPYSDESGVVGRFHQSAGIFEGRAGT